MSSIHPLPTVTEPSKYAYPYPAQGQGNYQGPPVQAPPQYYGAPPPRREPGFLEGCVAGLRCWCDPCDPSCCNPCDPSWIWCNPCDFLGCW